MSEQIVPGLAGLSENNELPVLQGFISRQVFDEGVNLASDEKYNESRFLFTRGEKIYNNLRRIQDSPDFRLQEQIFKLHKVESTAMSHLLNDENDQATLQFQEAIQVISEIVSTVKEFGQAALVHHFQLHSAYFGAMGSFCAALRRFDAEEHQEAKKTFEKVKTTLGEVSGEAKEISPPLVQSCKLAINLVDSYLETLNLLLE